MPTWPGLEEHRDLCIPLFGALPLWLLAVRVLWQDPAEPARTVPQTPPLLAA